MSSPEENSIGLRDKKDAMLVSMMEKKHSHQFHCQDSSSFENNLGLKLPKFSLNTKNYCSIHLRLLHNLNEERRHDIFMLNPEYHIKFLEKNLNILSRKPSRCNDFKINSSKNSSNSVETSQKVFSLSENRLPSLTFTSLMEGNVFQLNAIERNFDHRKSSDTGIFDRSKVEVPNVSLQTRPSDKLKLATPSIIKIKEKYNSKKNPSQVMKTKPFTSDKPTDSLKNKNDNDNQFEFTVAEEKIVSFVCSPPSSRKPRTKPNENGYICDSDEESTLSSSKGSSETASNASYNSSYSKLMAKKNGLPAQDHVMNTKKLLWHPPLTSRSAVSLSESKSIYSCSSFNHQVKQKTSEHCINFFGSINSMYEVSGDRKLKNSLNQETVMFREAALRGCYNIESLLKEVKTPLLEVEKEVNQTREAIFSAVRFQRDNSGIVKDCILSIVDICNSWMKLNAHFEQKDFKNFLELNEVDLTILGDFAQWQCISRIFVDKLINVLKKVSTCKSSKFNRQRDSITTRGTETTKVQPNLVSICETPSNNFPHVEPNLNTSPPSSTDSQGKRWKQRRFLSEKIDSVKVTLPSNRPCKSSFTVSSSFQRPLLPNNCNAETVFGQGDSGLNFACDFTKETIKNYQSAQGGVSVLLSGSKQLNSPNSGFFDKNINNSNTKCCNVRGETGICPVTPSNDPCTSIPNLLEMPVNNYYPVGLQQAVPTVPPLYNNQLCLLHQYQPNFNHCLAKPNPIHCMDADAGENFIQTSYMKPGHYTPPQKPVNFQKVVNNTVPIEDIPAVGIPFLYSAACTTSQQSKSLEYPNSLLQIQISKENNQMKDSDDIWKSALSMAGPFRDTMMADRIDDGPNLRVSETVSLKSHFLLSDDNSLTSSSSGDNFKVNSDSDELSSLSAPKKDTSVMKSKTKTTDWLIESFNKISVDNENSFRPNFTQGDILSEKEQPEITQINEESGKQKDIDSYFTSKYLYNTYDGSKNVKFDNVSNKEEQILSPFLKNEKGCIQKKPRNNKKCRDDYTTLFDRKHHVLYNKSDPLAFTTAMSNKVTCQLEDILNCIWNVKVSTLIEEEIKSEKEMSKLEVKVRSPLYLQAMRCKLSNHSYDTLGQALSDFHQYFVDIRNKNKGDKQCIEVVGALEHMYFGLLEKHFGLTYQSSPQYNNAVSMTTATKPRRTKKTPRRF